MKIVIIEQKKWMHKHIVYFKKHIKLVYFNIKNKKKYKK